MVFWFVFAILSVSPLRTVSFFLPAGRSPSLPTYRYINKRPSRLWVGGGNIGEETGKGDGKTLYEILGVSQDAEAKEIRKRFRQMRAELHPSVSKEEGGEERWNKIEEAFDTLKDLSKRAAYDRQLLRSRLASTTSPSSSQASSSSQTSTSISSTEKGAAPATDGPKWDAGEAVPVQRKDIPGQSQSLSGGREEGYSYGDRERERGGSAGGMGGLEGLEGQLGGDVVEKAIAAGLSALASKGVNSLLGKVVETLEDATASSTDDVLEKLPPLEGPGGVSAYREEIAVLQGALERVKSRRSALGSAPSGAASGSVGGDLLDRVERMEEEMETDARKAAFRAKREYIENLERKLRTRLRIVSDALKSWEDKFSAESAAADELDELRRQLGVSSAPQRSVSSAAPASPSSTRPKETAKPLSSSLRKPAMAAPSSSPGSSGGAPGLRRRVIQVVDDLSEPDPASNGTGKEKGAAERILRLIDDVSDAKASATARYSSSSPPSPSGDQAPSSRSSTGSSEQSKGGRGKGDEEDDQPSRSGNANPSSSSPSRAAVEGEIDNLRKLWGLT